MIAIMNELKTLYSFSTYRTQHKRDHACAPFSQLAAWQDYTDAVKLLVHWGACVNLKDDQMRSPLHFAAWASIKSSNCPDLETISGNPPRKSPSFETGKVFVGPVFH